MTAVWRFGDIRVAGFQNEIQDGVRELTPDAGNPFKRVSFTDVQDLIRGTFVVNRDDYLDFMDWFRNTIRQGSLSFSYYDCRIDASRTARIIGRPSFTTLSNKWVISISLSLEPVTSIVEFNLITETGDNLITETDDNLIVDAGLTV